MNLTVLENKKSIKDIVIELNQKGVKELREICKIYGIPINSSYIKKKNLIEIILDSRKKIKNKDKIQYANKIKNGAVYAIQGRRENMEDTYVHSSFGNTILYGVFDGHGGDEVSKSLPKLLSNKLLSSINEKNYKNEEMVKEIIRNIFLEIDNGLSKLNIESGSTAVMCLKINNYLYIINLGDSRGIVYYYEKTKNGSKKGQLNATFVTTDHKPDNKNEIDYITRNGGSVDYDNEDDSYRVNNQLAMSRAFGDFELKYNTDQKYKGPVSVNPDITLIKCDKNNKYFVILASDGLWDVISNKRCLGFLDKFGEVTGCKYLVKEAYDKESWDNICVLTAQVN